MRATPLLALTLLLLVGCNQATSGGEAAAKSERSKLAKGTKVRAILLKELTSGGSKEGEEVPLMVVEDVKDAKGRVLIPKGTPIRGEVTWSRSEGTLGALMNQPARLEFKFVEMKAADGTAVKLSAAQDKDEEYALNRANTGRVSTSAQIEALSENRDQEQVLEALRQVFEGGDVRSLESAEGKQRLEELSQQLGLQSTERVVKQGEVGRVVDLVQQIRRGASVSTLASGGSLGVVDAAIELAGVAGQVGNRLSRMLGGRNIRAYVGTPIEAYVLEDVELTVKG